jgi:dynein heavy chain
MVGEGTALHREENYFETAKRYLLNDPKELLELLMNFDKHSVTPE